jgi:hypothetical protein
VSTNRGEHRDDLEPPRHVWFTLDEAPALLAGLEDARDALIDSRGLATVVGVENQIRLVSRKLGLDEPEEDDDGG